MQIDIIMYSKKMKKKNLIDNYVFDYISNYIIDQICQVIFINNNFMDGLYPNKKQLHVVVDGITCPFSFAHPRKLLTILIINMSTLHDYS